MGDGPLDLAVVPGWVSHVEAYWEHPLPRRFLQRLASFSRLILFDKRGTGMSDRVADVPTLEERMDDLRAVLDAVSSRRAALLGFLDGAAMCALFAATYPERTQSLVMGNAFVAASGWRGEQSVLGSELAEATAVSIEQGAWGTGQLVSVVAPSAADDRTFVEWWARFERLSASPGAAAAFIRLIGAIDIRDALGVIRVPSLVVHRDGDPLVSIAAARRVAAQIQGARFAEVPGVDALPYVGDVDRLLDEIEEFLTGVRHGPEIDRVLATVVFTDIVGSTERAAELGDRRWGELLERHHSSMRHLLEQYRGHEVDTAGDGFFATFDGPARAIRCACALREDVRGLGIEVRAGVHTGECTMIGGKVGGIAVHIGARVAASAPPGEILVSSTVKDLVVGSGIAFADRGAHRLKGVPDEWHLFAVEP